MRVCLVCTGNICRSPMADVVLRQIAIDTRLPDGGTLADQVAIDSAGTGNWHAGDPMDPRAVNALAARGYVDHGHRARAFKAEWFDRYDMVVSMARVHQQTLAGLARSSSGRAGGVSTELVLLRSFDRRAGGQVDVPDPYYGDSSDFETCLTMVEAGCRGLASSLATRLTSATTDQDPGSSSDAKDSAS